MYSVPLTLHSASIFSNANNVVVRGGNFYCVGRDLLIALQGERSSTSFKSSDDNISALDFNRTPEGIIEGAEVVCFGLTTHLRNC